MPRLCRQPFILVLLALAVLLPPGPRARAQAAFVPPWPKDLDKVDVYLLTVGRGPQIWALYGHTIIRVVDKSNHLDLNFNWGIFDFKDPLFAWKFYLGDLDYMMAITDYWSLVEHYRNVEHRGVISDKLVLTAAQKAALYRRLIANSQPENLHYQYSQFRDNCSTKPRDHLDQVLGGQIKAAYGNRLASAPFRDYIKRDSAPIWWVSMGLDTASNVWLDLPVSDWQQMFLPANLRVLLARLPAYDDNGQPLPGRSLLEGTEVVVDAVEPGPSRDPYMMLTVLLGLPFAAAALALAGRPSERASSLMLGLMSTVFGLWSGLWGTLLSADWAISHYPELKHNAALWLFWPVDWLFAAFGLRLLIMRARPRSLGRLAGAVRFVGSAHLLGLTILAGLWLVGIIQQDVLPVLASSGILALIYYGTVIRHGAAREP